MIEPGPPRPGEPLRASWAQRLIAYVRSLRVFAGPGLVARRTPSGTVVSLAPNAGLRRGRPPMPFDCRLGTGGGNGDETHLFCYVPNRNGGLVTVAGGRVTATFCGDDSAIANDWLDLGGVQAGAQIRLRILVSSSDWAAAREAAPVIDYARWAVCVGSSVPSGYVSARTLGPDVLLAEWTSDGLRQRFHGPYRADVAQGDSDVSGGSIWSSSTPLTRSVTSDQGAMTMLHGFRSPTVVSNPYKSGGTPPSSNDDLLLLVRVASGSTAELKYIKLSDLAAADPSGDGSPPPPPEYQDIADDYHDRVDLPCPNGHDRTTPLVIYWNPCDLEDAQGSVLQPAGWQQGRFWLTGGDERTCNGSYVGDSSGNKAIYLDGHRLTGPNGNKAWAADGNFTVDGDIITPNTVHTNMIDATSSVQCGGRITATGNIGTPANISCGGTLTVGSGASAVDVGATLSGLETLLSQI